MYLSFLRSSVSGDSANEQSAVIAGNLIIMQISTHAHTSSCTVIGSRSVKSVSSLWTKDYRLLSSRVPRNIQSDTRLFTRGKARTASTYCMSAALISWIHSVFTYTHHIHISIQHTNTYTHIYIYILTQHKAQCTYLAGDVIDICERHVQRVAPEGAGLEQGLELGPDHFLDRAQSPGIRRRGAHIPLQLT